MLLALDTSTPYVAAALYDPESQSVVASERSVAPMQHGEQAMVLISEIIGHHLESPRAVTALAVGVGPGPYTGLRVGLVSIRTLALTWGVPAVGLVSLDVLAAEAAAGGMLTPFVVTADARRKELFYRVYDQQAHPLSKPLVGPAEDLPAYPVVGVGPELYPQLAAHPGGPRLPDAGWLARCAHEGLAELQPVEPVYLRRPDAVVPGPTKRVL